MGDGADLGVLEYSILPLPGFENKDPTVRRLVATPTSLLLVPFKDLFEN